MSRYIDADKLQQVYKEIHGGKRLLLIDTEPTADVRENVKGEWLNTRPDAPMFGFYYCSICGRKRTSPQDHYCPNCGADMRGEVND